MNAAGENSAGARPVKAPLLPRLRAWLKGGGEYGVLPARIRRAIVRQQDGSERLIGWIQLAILTSFAALYAAAPKTAPSGAEFEPVPVFLGVYLIFTCLRLWRAYKTSLPFWFLVVSILVDMALLLGLIWSFHLQYAQPPSFYLKAPTLLYIFIFISLRALRFEPGYVLLAGLVGAAGWLALVFFAINTEGGDAVITRNYVEYLTSNSVLLGGEVDKIISIMVVTIVLSLAIARARRLLIQSIVEGSTAENLSHFVPEGIADRIAAAEGPLINAQTETREATILFADMVSFTSVSERLSPNELIATVNEYFELIDAPIARHRGVVCYFQGDAVLASFNLPSTDPDHASNAVAAAVEIQQRLARHRFATGVTLQARIGINTGNVVGGFVGTPDRMSYTVYGDDVNIAARLEQLNKTRGTSILVAERTMQLSDQQRFQFEARGSEVLRGRHAAINVFSLDAGVEDAGT
ncbi:MAG: adenylate/guanylate cyclase domain-containing protein [Gammaproteobacteria bacterium]